MSLLSATAVSISTMASLPLLGELQRPFLGFLVIAAVVAAFLFAQLVLVMKQYKRCPPNRAMVVFGRTGPGASSTKVLHGGAAFVVPLFQDYGYLSLEPLQVDVPALPTSDVTGFNFGLPSLYTVAIGTDEESLHTAAVRLLGMELDDIRNLVRPIIHTQVVQLTETKRAQGTEVTQISFANELKPALDKQLGQLGLQLINIGQMAAIGLDSQKPGF